MKIKLANSDSFLSGLNMKTLPTVHPVKMRHSEKKNSFLNKSVSIQNTKELSLLKWYLFISKLVAMTTVKLSFVFILHATVSAYQISKDYLFK